VINPEVRREIFRKLKISQPALSQRAKRIKNKFGPMTTDEAVYVIAHMEGIDLAKYLSLQILDRIRSLVPREIAPSKPTAIQRGKPEIKKRRERIHPYPLISRHFIQRVITIGEEAFPQIVMIENSMRNLIERTLLKIKTDWWEEFVPPNVKGMVQRTIKKEEKYSYREKRGDKPLLYCNFTDLKEIIIANKNHFAGIIFDFGWFESKMNEIYMARNNLAHSVLLSNDDISRIALFYKDWARLLESAGIE
jgi:hypothetical protein